MNSLESTANNATIIHPAMHPVLQIMKRTFSVSLALTTLLNASALRAEEGASGHYMPGATASFIDALLGGIIGAGANAFYYQQVTGDSGSGATLGDMEGRTAGVGPVLSYVRKLGNADLAAEVKWLPELEVEKRPKGDFVWAKVGVVF